MKIARVVIVVLVLVCLTAGVGIYSLASGWFGEHEGPGTVTNVAIDANVLRERDQMQRAAARTRGVPDAKQILFGDLHVHTTFSFDAFLLSLPLMAGEGAHPPADACDYARFCSGLDFWSINDHAEALTPQHWQETVDAIRQCNAVAGDPENPDVVAFLGWEWTQVGMTPDHHYGHKNVILRDLEDGKIPTRPIAARGFTNQAMRENGPGGVEFAYLTLKGRDSRYQDFARYALERLAVDDCPEDVHVSELPADCRESTATPEALFRKLDEWGHESMVIPHGTTWGFYTPPGSKWDKQLVGNQHDPERQGLIEVMSGHGNSEEYRDFRAVEFDKDGKAFCPGPTPSYMPSCWQGGEVIRRRCEAKGFPAEECEKRAAQARQHYVDAGTQGHLVIPGARLSDWLDSGQCRDCFLPSFNYRPGGSVQYIMALSNFDELGEDGRPRRFRFGFMASSDNHSARPGTGYKEYGRRGMTEASGPIDAEWRDILAGEIEAPTAESQPFDRTKTELVALRLVEAERQASFFLTGGLIAVHAAGRNRGAIWDAMQKRETYGTSGERILLWFDLLNPPEAGGQPLPMGSEVEMSVPPHFQVRAVGAFEQADGCPEHSTQALSPERLELLCRGECYNPTERRKIIDRIEIVRIRPQQVADEPVHALIDDPWRVFPCRPDPAGCTAAFHDPEFVADGRDALYYARAVQQPSYAVNADNLRCDSNERGECTTIRPCYGDFRTEIRDDCLSLNEERAWSSPIFVDFGS